MYGPARILGLIAGTFAAGAPSGFRHLGRVNPATNELTWPGTGLSFTFTGTSASVPIRVNGTNSVQMIIDGETPIILNSVTGSTISTPKLSNGRHTVEIRKKSGPTFGSIFISKPTVSSSPTTSPAKRIEIIGDSISVGYGADGVNPCTNTAALEDAPNTYGALTAKNLSADYSIVAWSGKGVIRNYVSATIDTSPTQPQLWTRYGANDTDNSYDGSYKPDTVVINLGTNDFSYLLPEANGQSYRARPDVNVSAFTNAYIAFAKKVQKTYNGPEMFLTSSPLLNDYYPSSADAQHTVHAEAVKQVVAALGSKAHFVDFPTQDTSVNPPGCDYHPSRAQHVIMSSILTQAIQSVIR